jgi:hypothetical protein
MLEFARLRLSRPSFSVLRQNTVTRENREFMSISSTKEDRAQKDHIRCLQVVVVVVACTRGL